MSTLRRLSLMAVSVMATMAMSSASIASATTLEIGSTAQNNAVEIGATLQSGTSMIVKDEVGFTTDTCTTSELKAKTEGSFTGPRVSGKVGTMTFGGCTHTTTVDANGTLSVEWISGTNGNVISAGTELTLLSTWWGVTALCKTGTGTKIGTITGTKTGHATIDITATINCGIIGNATWTGTYTATSPTGLGAVN